MRTLSTVAIVTLLSLVAGRTDAADPWPAHAIRIVVAVPAGSPADIDARILAEGYEKELGAPVVVDNRPGADGIIAVGLVTAAAADGHTLLFGLGSQFAVNPVLYAKLPYDPRRDLQPVSLVARQGLLVAVHPSLPVSSLRELADYSRANPGSVNYGAGTSTFMLAAEAMKRHGGMDLQHIPFNGVGPAMTALLGGTVQVALMPATTALAAAQAGKMRVIAVAGTSRLAALPDVPTLAEAGYPDEVPVWTAVFAPAGTPGAIIERLNAATLRTLATPANRARFAASAETVIASTPEELGATIVRDTARMEALARRIGLAPR